MMLPTFDVPFNREAGNGVWFRRAIWAEAVMCFAAPTALLLLGTVFAPLMAAVGVFSNARDPRSLIPLLLVALGWAGLVGVRRVIRNLVAGGDARRDVTVACLAAGLSALLLLWAVARVRDELPVPAYQLIFFCAPLLCTAHLTYLARRSLFA